MQIVAPPLRPPSAGFKVKFSLIIATLDDDGDLIQCLESIEQLNHGPSFEVIVVDQNGDDRLVDLIAKFNEKFLIRHEQVSFKGGSRARNHGAQFAVGQWLGFPDDDCKLLPDVLQQLERLARNDCLQVITGQTIDSDDSPNVMRWGTETKNFSRWTMFGCLCEATLFVQRDIFISINGFDERFGPGARFPAAEGIDLMNRLFGLINQGQALYSPDIKMRHPTKIPPWNRWAVSRFHSYARGDGALIGKHFQPHMIYWGLRTTCVSLVQLFKFRGWQSLAYAARLAGLVEGFCSFCFRRGRG